MPSALEPFSPSSHDLWDVTKAAHLLRRAGFAPLPAEIARAIQAGPDRAVDALFQFPAELPPLPAAAEIQHAEARVNDVVQESIRTGIKPKDNPALQSAIEDANRAHGRGFVALTAWWLDRMAHGPSPLQEKLTLFWHGHFTTSAGDVHDAIAVGNQNQLLRQHAAGDFGRLLDGVARDPAMLRYLNNDSNRKGHPNENWARELMELYTMGIGQYTEIDIRESARAWTGWTLRDYRTFEDRRTFEFKPALHDTGTKTFLGQAGNLDGTDVMRIILGHRATPRWIAGRLARFFVAPAPDPDLVEAMGQTLASNNYEIAPVLRVLFRSRAFYRPQVIHAQVKSPVEFVVGSVRHLGIRDPNWPALAQMAAQAGQRLFYPPTVKGWDGGKAWINAATIFNRSNLAGALLSGKLGTADTTALSSLETMAAQLLQRPLPAARRPALGQALKGAGRDAAIHLIMSLPEYQVS